MALAPRAADGYLLHPGTRINRGDTAAAESDYKHLIKPAPQSALGCTKLGELRAQQKRWTEADVLLHQALDREPGSLDAIQALTSFYVVRNEPVKALKFVQSRIDSDPNNSELYLFRAQAQLQSNNREEAERSLSRSLELRSDSVNALILLAQTQASLQPIDQAIVTYQRAAGLAPNSTPLYVSLGSLYEVKGSWPQAQALYRKALAISPDDAAAVAAAVQPSA